MFCSTSSLSSSLSSSSSSVNLFLLGKNHEARTNPKQIHERTREEKKISSSSWKRKKRRRRRKKRNANAKNNNAIVDDDVNVELQDGVIGARDARLYAQTKRLEDLERTVKKNVEEDKEENSS